MALEFDRKAWLTERKSAVGGSDIGPITGNSAYGKTAADVYDEKVAVVTVDAPPTWDMERGRIFEPIVDDLFCKRANRKTRRQSMRRHKKYPVIAGNVDRQQITDPRGPGVAEYKVPRISTFNRIKAKGLPDQHSLQVQQYLEVFNYDWGSFAIFNADSGQLIWFDVERNREVGEMIVHEGCKFWETYVIPRERPPEAKPVKFDLEEIKGDTITVSDPEFLDAMNDLWEARELMASAKLLKDATDDVVQNLMKDRLGGFGVVETPNNERIHYKMVDGKHSLQKDWIQAAGPLDPIIVREMIERDIGMHEDDLEEFMVDLQEKAGMDVLDKDNKQFYKIGDDYPHFVPYQLKRRVVEND